MTFNFLN